MTTQKNLEAKVKVDLYYLRNNLDIWYRLVDSWLDKKSIPQQNDIKKLGIEVVRKLCIMKVLKKKDIEEMKFPELYLTPRRSSSASPNRPTTPDSASRRPKSITRVSPKDQHVIALTKCKFKEKKSK